MKSEIYTIPLGLLVALASCEPLEPSLPLEEQARRQAPWLVSQDLAEISSSQCEIEQTEYCDANGDYYNEEFALHVEDGHLFDEEGQYYGEFDDGPDTAASYYACSGWYEISRHCMSWYNLYWVAQGVCQDVGFGPNAQIWQYLGDCGSGRYTGVSFSCCT